MKRFCEAFTCQNVSTCLYGVECDETEFCLCGMECINCVSYMVCKKSGRLRVHNQNSREEK